MGFKLTRPLGVAIVAVVVNASGTMIPAAQISPSARSQPDNVIAISNVTIIDVAAGARRFGQTVITRHGQITEIGPRIAVPRGAIRVDGRARFLIPGLWDMHSHNQAAGIESLDLYF